MFQSVDPPTGHRVHAGKKLAVIVLIYLALAAAYSIVTPIGRGADEWAHYWYAQFIAQHRRLPLTVAERDAAGYKSDWPPLYHLAAAAVTGWVDTAGPPDFHYRTDSIRRQMVPADGPDAILHTEAELFPWRQEVLVWHLGRFLSIFFSAGTLLVTYCIAIELWQQKTGAAAEQPAGLPLSLQFTIRNLQFLPLLTVAVLAFTPRFLFTGMLFNYDSLTLLLASLFLWLALRVARGLHTRWGFGALGALAGVAMMTKYLAALLPVVIVVAAGSRVVREQRCRGAEVQGREVAALKNGKATTAHPSQFTIHNLQFIIQAMAQAALAYVLTTGWWFAYLIKNFHEIDTYGPVLGTLAPLIRGDASDRTVEQLFAWLSGGQAPPPAHIDQQTYTAWQLITGFFTTLWANPIIQPFPLNWFVAVMTLLAGLAAIGLILHSKFKIQNSQFTILLLTCLLPTPFMLIRLFGARDALEAVQGRHILFLAGPAMAVLLVMGLATVLLKLRNTQYAIRLTLYALPALLLTGSMGQLMLMAAVYPPPLPIVTALPQGINPPPAAVSLPGGSALRGYQLKPHPDHLKVSLFWQGGPDFAPEDYRLELALVNGQGQVVSGYAAYQTQARYPTRAWEPGSLVRDDGWLPVVNLPTGEYAVQMRLLGQTGPVVNWQTLGDWQVAGSRQPTGGKTLLWRNGHVTGNTPLFHERETVQVTLAPLLPSPSAPPPLIGPQGNTYPPASAGPGWASFIIEPHWPAGLYRLENSGPVLQVASTPRQFAMPPIPFAVDANFAGQISLLGYDLPARRVEPGGGLPVTLFWQGQKWLAEDFVIFARLLDNAQVARGGYDRRAKENYSTLFWAPGEIITDGFAVPVDPTAPNGVYTLSVGWYRRAAGGAESLPLLNPDTGEPTGLTAVTLGPVKVGGPPPGVTVAQAAPENVVNVVLGDQIKLLGFDVSGLTFKVESSEYNPQPGTLNLKLVFLWQSLRAPDNDYTVFVHVRNAAGEVVAQKDRPPVNGAYPTGLWDTGEIIRDEVEVSLDGLASGRYQVAAGLYDAATGQRLAVEGLPDGAILLQEFEVNQ